MTAVVLGLVALVALLGTVGYPSGEQGVPGPALFPRTVAVALLLCATWLMVTAASTPVPDALPPGMGRVIGWTALALVLYVATWDLVPFVPRTALLVLFFLRMLAVSWRAAAVTATVLAGVVFIVFERVLAVRL